MNINQETEDLKIDKENDKENDKKNDKENDNKDLKNDDKKLPKGFKELKIKPHSTCLVLGRRGVGKSFMSKYLIYHMLRQKIYDTFYLFSTTERYSHSFDCFPKEYIVDGFDLKFIQSIIKAQQKRIDKYGKESPNVASILLVFDDLLGSIQTGSHEMQYINYLFSCSRHLNCGLLVISQSAKSLISPVVRNNADLIIWRQINDNYLRSIYESVYWNSNLKSFMNFTKRSFVGTDFEFLCYDNMCDKDDERWLLLLAEHTDFQIEMKRRNKDEKKKRKTINDK